MHGLLNKMVPKKKRKERIQVKIILNPSLEELEKWGPTAWVFDTETTGLEVAGATAPHSMRYIGIGPLSDITICYIWHVSEFTETIRNFLNKQTLIAHNAKFDIHAAKLRPKGDVYDTALMVYHSDTLARKRLDDMARVLGLPKIATPELLKEGRIDEVRPDIVQEYLADDVATTNLLANTLIYNKTTGWKIQHDASKVFAKAEHRGIRFVPENFGRMVPIVQEALDSKMAVLNNSLGFDGNLGSPKQLSEWLLMRGIKLPLTDASLKNPDKPKRYSTNKLVLEKLSWEGCEEAQAVIDARRMLKLQQAFMNTLPDKVRQDGMIYPSINMGRTKTGRLSYNNPNLQQIPKHNEIGKGLRACFTGPSGYLSVADYSQVEMRVAAGLSGDPILLDIFERGHDLHSEVAAVVLNKRREDLTTEERFSAKAINFGILNGMGPKRLSHSLRSTLDEAKRWLNEYRNRFHVLNNWMQTTWDEAEVNRIVHTASGRTRIFRREEESVRSAVSIKVQGTAADLLYAAVVAVDDAGLDPVFSVHDEIACDSREINELVNVMEEAANNAFPELFKDVKFKADGYLNDTWKEPNS
jgi:DNA polymerase-1